MKDKKAKQLTCGHRDFHTERRERNILTVCNSCDTVLVTVIDPDNKDLKEEILRRGG